MTEEEIRRVCEEWVRGEHFPVQDADEVRLQARLAEHPELWWRVLREMMEDLSDPDEGSNLAYVLAPLMELKGPKWEPDLVAQTRDSRQAASVVAEAFDLGHSDRTPREDRLRAYELFGREVVIGTWLRYLRAESDWDFWPYALISELTSAHPEEAWVVLTTMIDLAPSDDIDVLGAGFLEDLLGGPLADAWIERIESHGRSSERFREALGHLWIDGDVPEDTFLRIERTAGVPLARRRTEGT